MDDEMANTLIAHVASLQASGDVAFVVLRVAADWELTEADELIDEDTLTRLTIGYARVLNPDAPVDASQVSTAIRTAIAEVEPGKSPLNEDELDGRGGYFIDPDVLEYLTSDCGERWTIPDAMWVAAIESTRRESLFDIGHAAEVHGNFERASDAYLKLLPEHDVLARMAAVNLSTIYKAQRRVDEAERVLRSALTNPGDELHRMLAFGLAELLITTDRDEAGEAEALLREALVSQRAELAAGAAYRLGTLLKTRGPAGFTEASRLFSAAMQGDPSTIGPVAAVELASIWLTSGQSDDAKRLLERILATGHPVASVEAALRLSAMYAIAGDLEASRRLAEHAYAADAPAEIHARAALALASVVESDHAEPRERPQELFQEIIASGDPKTAAMARTERGAMLIRSADPEDVDRGKSLLEQALDSGVPEVFPRATVALGEYLIHSDDPLECGRGEDLLRQVAEGKDGEVRSHALFDLGVHLMNATTPNAQSQAIELFREVVALGGPGADEAALNLAILLMETGGPADLEQATTLLRTTSDSDDPELRGRASAILAQSLLERSGRNGTREIEGLLHRAVNSRQVTAAPAAAFELARIYETRGEVERVEDLLRLAIHSEDEQIAARAKLSLASFLARQDDAEQEVEELLQQVLVTRIPSASADAAYRIGIRLLKRANPYEREDAQRLLRQAQATGSPELATLATSALSALGVDDQPVTPPVFQDIAHELRSGFATARQCTVRILDTASGRDPDEQHRGHGLLLELPEIGLVVLTCRHIIAPVDPGYLAIVFREDDGRTSRPVACVYQQDWSSPEKDLAVLKPEIDTLPFAARPLLRSVDPASYPGGVHVTCLTWLQPDNFNAELSRVTTLRVRAEALDVWPQPPSEYILSSAFRLASPTDTRPGISGAVVVAEDAIVGLTHFARSASPEAEREAYVVPISDWIDGLGQISPVVEPLISRSLLAAAEVRRAHAVRIGAEFPIAGFREFYLDRDAFAQADSALNDLGAVLLVGKPKSGKTRLAWNLVHQNPNAVVVLPIDTEPPTLNSPCGLEGCDVFLVIDDIQKSAQGLNVLSWWRHLKMLSARCRLICTCGDGDDWEFVQKNQALLVRMLDPAGLVFTSRVGSQGADETPTWGWRLAQSLGLTWKEFTDRFDGTPGSLVLDLSDMKRRYEKLANEWFAGIPASRLLDAVKLLKYGQQPRYREPVIRAAAGRILGKTEISDEVWRTLVRRTTEEGFGWMVSSNTSIERALATYGPYLNVCVTYEQNDAHVTELIDVLVDQNDGHGLLYLGSAFPFDKADLAIRAYTESAKLGYTPAYVGLGRLYGSPLVGQYKTAEAMLREAIKRGNEDASYELGWVYARMRKYRAAEKAFRVLVDAGATEVNFVLANVLARQKSREGEAEAAYRAAIQVGYYDAYLGLGLLLSGQPGREKDAEDAFWAAARLLNDSAALLFAAAVKNGNRLSATPPDDLFGAGPNAFGIVVHPKQSRQPVFRRLRTNLLKLLGRASPHNDQP